MKRLLNICLAVALLVTPLTLTGCSSDSEVVPPGADAVRPDVQPELQEEQALGAETISDGASGKGGK